jgi:hypothetical protein
LFNLIQDVGIFFARNTWIVWQKAIPGNGISL